MGGGLLLVFWGASCPEAQPNQLFGCRYNVVFKYLLSVRRVQAELQHCWALQMRCKCLESRRTDAIKWQLRHHMTFLVDNLQYYLQVSVRLGG